MTTSHGIAWEDVREVLASSLTVGDRWVKPGCGAAYMVGKDGAVRGHGLVWAEPLDGTLWTVTGRAGDRVTAVSHDGRTVSDTIPEHAHVLRVIK